MADAQARKAAIKKASYQVRTGCAFVRHARAMTPDARSTKEHELRFAALSARARRVLRRKGLHTLDQISEYSEDQLTHAFGLDDELMKELYGPLLGAGLNFRQESR